jgi:hypothetical protein
VDEYVNIYRMLAKYYYITKHRMNGCSYQWDSIEMQSRKLSIALLPFNCIGSGNSVPLFSKLPHTLCSPCARTACNVLSTPTFSLDESNRLQFMDASKPGLKI